MRNKNELKIIKMKRKLKMLLKNWIYITLITLSLKKNMSF